MINGHDIPLMGEHHDMEDIHGVHIVVSLKDGIVNGSINHPNINKD